MKIKLFWCSKNYSNFQRGFLFEVLGIGQQTLEYQAAPLIYTIFSQKHLSLIKIKCCFLYISFVFDRHIQNSCKKKVSTCRHFKNLFQFKAKTKKRSPRKLGHFHRPTRQYGGVINRNNWWSVVFSLQQQQAGRI